MHVNDIREIELTLGITLPDHFINYIIPYPQSLTLLKERMGHMFFIYDNSQQLILMNQMLGVHGSEKYIKHKLAIGENGGGDYYFIDLQNPKDQKVYFYDHEESTENYYDPERDEWQWHKLEFYANLKAYEEDLLSMFEDDY